MKNNYHILIVLVITFLTFSCKKGPEGLKHEITVFNMDGTTGAFPENIYFTNQKGEVIAIKKNGKTGYTATGIEGDTLWYHVSDKGTEFRFGGIPVDHLTGEREVIVGFNMVPEGLPAEWVDLGKIKNFSVLKIKGKNKSYIQVIDNLSGDEIAKNIE